MARDVTSFIASLCPKLLGVFVARFSVLKPKRHRPMGPTSDSTRGFAFRLGTIQKAWRSSLGSIKTPQKSEVQIANAIGL